MGRSLKQQCKRMMTAAPRGQNSLAVVAYARVGNDRFSQRSGGSFKFRFDPCHRLRIATRAWRAWCYADLWHPEVLQLRPW